MQRDRPYAALGAVGALVVAAAGLVALSKRRLRPVYTRQEWEDCLTETGTICGFENAVEQICDRGLDPNIRADVWPFLLEVFDHASTYAQRQHQHYLMTSQYQQLLLQCQAYEAVLKESLRPASPSQAQPAQASAGGLWQEPTSSNSSSIHNSSKSPQPPQPPQQHLQLQQQLPEQVRQFVEAHRIIVIDSVRTDFQKHAAALQLQPDPSPASSSGNSNSSGLHRFASAEYASSIGVAAVAAVSQGLNSSLSTLQQWQQHWLGSLLGGQAAMWGHTQAQWVSEAAQLVLDSSSHLPDDSKRQAARMIAMLSAYALHDPDTGYCQGMSDLLLPFLLLMDDDAMVFWCFVALMQRLGLRQNFAVDESGIFGQLRRLGQVLEVCDKPVWYKLHQLGTAECHFAYRMVVVMMRRDLPMPKVLQLWEVLWAYSWRQRHGAEQHAQAASPAAADSGQHKAPISPSTASTAAAAVDSGKSERSSHNEGSAEQSSCTVLADGRASAAAKQSKGTAGSAANNSSLQQQPHLDLFVCFVAEVITAQRRTILDHCYNADDVLRLFHGLRHIDLWQCLDKAHTLLGVVQKL